MRRETELLREKTADLGELWEIRQRAKERYNGSMDAKLKEFAEEFRRDPLSIPKEDMSAAYKIFLMMKLVPNDPNPN